MKNLRKFYFYLKFLIAYNYHIRSENLNIDNYSGIRTIGIQINEPLLIPKKIWVFWEGTMPKIVDDCLSTMKKMHQEYDFVIINNNNLSNYCDIYFEELGVITPQQKSDLIRLNLLYNYGGYWLDASIILYEKLDWISQLLKEKGSTSFAYYRARNTTQMNFPVIENWLMCSITGDLFFKKWFDELFYALKITPKKYIKLINSSFKKPNDIFQNIGNLEYLVAYVACQKVMREHEINMTLINCDENAFFYQVNAKWIKQKILVDFAINTRPEIMPKLVKLAGKERKYLNYYYEKKKFFKDSLLDFENNSTD